MLKQSSRWKAYPKYKDSGIAWLGEVPEGWEVKRVKNLLVERKGAIKTGPFGSQLHNSEMADGEIKVFNQKTVIERNIHGGENYISIDKFNELMAFEVFPRDLIITTRGTIGRCMIVPDGAEKGILHPCLIRIQLNDRLAFDHYVEILIQESGLIIKQLQWMSNATTIEVIYSESLKEVCLPLPPLLEQATIAAYLDKKTANIDTLIEKKQHQIELLKEKRTALISHAVTKGLDPNAKLKDSGIEWLGEVPERWEIRRVKYIASINDEALSEDTDLHFELNYVDIGSIDANYGIQKKEQMRFENAPSRARRKVMNGDVIVSTVRTYLRAIAPIINPEANLIVSTGFAVIRPCQKIENSFAAYIFRAPYFVDTIVSRSVGVSYPAVNASDIADIRLALPSLPEQRTIAAYLDKGTARIDALIEKVTKSIALLREYRTALISAAVTGKIDVRREAA